MIERVPVHHKVVSLSPSRFPDRWHKAVLVCGSEQLLHGIGGRFVNVVGLEEVKVGSSVYCFDCVEKEYRARLKTRPAEKAERFETREALLEEHPNAKWHEYGPLLKYGEQLRVQTYLGGHLWLAFNVDDLRDVWTDAGWEGTNYGWGYVAEEHVKYASDSDVKEGKEPPDRGEHKPITGDALLFADSEKLKAYLGPDDPLLRSDK